MHEIEFKKTGTTTKSYMIADKTTTQFKVKR